MSIIKLNLKKFKFDKLSKLSFVDKVFFLVPFLLMRIFSPDLVIIIIFLLIIPYLIITKRKPLFYQFFVAFILALVWIFISNGNYKYSNDYVVFFGINIFPMFSWTVGLFGLYLVYSHYEHILNKTSFLLKFGLFTFLYWVLLITVESIAFHIFDIRNIMNIAYKGLPLCNCIHAPFWMQAAYFLIGPAFYLICSLRLKNSHIVTSNIKSHV